MERIYVTVRSRPLPAEEAKNSPWRIAGNSIFLANQPRFEFDKVFGEDCRTAEIYGARTKDIVASAVRGFNGKTNPKALCTVFAYGQTNSGKTHTMRGSSAEPGIIPLAVHDLFESIQEDVDREFLVRMSYMEIYNEEINDLLAPEHRKLQIHESLERGIYVGGLKEEIVTCPEQVLDFMEFGESHRHIGETNMNLHSSRSHTIFRMIVESRERSKDGDQVDTCDAVRVSVLNLVDLAGSERAAKTGAEGMRLKEGSHINKSLMALGTVIKKLSEGAESQGGHVPYRDSKLTRILQPALGGNANTAMICNITLAQAHVDETKSSLQFASRALRVTNCACVNEILTDAALLRRQRKEIEELRAKLLSSHSDHWEEEILNLRNTLLQSELEKERIALELEEEKKAKAHHEKRLLEQIANLSSFVFCSERDEKSTCASKNKRRVTWCPGPLTKKCADEACTPDRATTMRNHFEHSLDIGLPVPFKVLMQENEPSTDVCSFKTEDGGPGDSSLPDAHVLLKVTNRRKKHVKTASLYGTSNESVEDHSAYEDEVLENHAQKKVEEVGKENSVHKLSRGTTNQSDSFSPASPGHTSLPVREKEAILVIKQLQDQIKSLESEKASIQNNLDNVLELATEQNVSFTKKYEELLQEAINAREEARVAHEQLVAAESVGASKQETMAELSVMVATEVKDLASHADHSRNSVDDILSFSEDLLQSFSVFSDALQELRSFASQDMVLVKSVICGHKDVQKCMKRKNNELEQEKDLLSKRSIDYEKQVRELISDVEKRQNDIIENNLQHDLEKDELLSQVLNLQKEVSYLSSSSLTKEMEILRKELDKTKSKLKDTESKLKNAVQDKMKIEGEKAQAEREIRHLHSQKAVLERDMLKRDSVSDKRRESRSDFGRPKGHSSTVDHALQENYQKLEIHVFEMETEIASLKEALIIASENKEEACRMNEFLNTEVESLSSKLNAMESEIKSLKEEKEVMLQRLIESEKYCKEMRDSIGLLSGEKEEMALQLTDALLEMEAEKSTWTNKEKALVIANEEIKVQSDEIIKLSDSLAEVKSKFDMLATEHCHACEEVLKLQEQLSNLIKERDESTHLDVNSGPGIDLSKDYENLKSDLLKVVKEKDELLSKNEKLNSAVFELETQKKQWEDMLSTVKTNSDELAKKLSHLEIKMHSDGLSHNKEKTDLVMQIQSLQGKLDAVSGKYREAISEMAFMHRKYEEASTKLKKQLATYGVEILSLKKQLSEKE